MSTCSAPSESADVTGIYCELPEGHKGSHEATTVITWSEEEGVRDGSHDVWGLDFGVEGGKA